MLPHIVRMNKLKENVMSGHVTGMREINNSRKVLVFKLERKSTLIGRQYENCFKGMG
jgi:hypothetical protein